MKRLVAIIVALGILTVGSVGLAQEEVPPSDSPPTQPLGERVLVEGAGALLGGIGGGMVGSAIGLVAAGIVDEGALFQGALVGGVAGAAVGYPAGAYLGGRAAGGDGGLMWTYLGAGIGFGTATALNVALIEAGMEGDSPLVPVSLGLSAGMVLSGPILGFELSHAANRPKPATTRRLRIQPFVTPTRRTDGGLFGFSAQF